jgi:hypothetical protein
MAAPCATRTTASPRCGPSIPKLYALDADKGVRFYGVEGDGHRKAVAEVRALRAKEHRDEGGGFGGLLRKFTRSSSHEHEEGDAEEHAEAHGGEDAEDRGEAHGHGPGRAFGGVIRAAEDGRVRAVAVQRARMAEGSGSSEAEDRDARIEELQDEIATLQEKMKKLQAALKDLQRQRL